MLRYLNPRCWIYVIASDHLFTAHIEKKVESTKFKVFSFETGEAFFQEVLYNEFPKYIIPIIVIDYNLTSRHHIDVKDGLAVLEEIQQQQPTWTVITASTVNEKSVKNEALKKGAFIHIFKNDNSFSRIDSVIKQVVSVEKMKRNKKIAIAVSYSFIAFLIISIAIFALNFF